MVSAGLGVGAGCWFSPCLMIRFRRSTSIACSAGRDAARVEASVLPVSMPVAEGGEGVRPSIAVSGVAVAVLPPVGTPMVVEGEDGGAPRPSESVFRPSVRGLVNWRWLEGGFGIWSIRGKSFGKWKTKGKKHETRLEVPKAGFCRGEWG